MAQMTYLFRKIGRRIQSLTPEQVDILLGASLAFDPYPIEQFNCFTTDDTEAFMSDWNAIGRDMRLVIAQKQNERLRSSR